jgi:hypothetical protein
MLFSAKQIKVSMTRIIKGSLKTTKIQDPEKDFTFAEILKICSSTFPINVSGRSLIQLFWEVLRKILSM